MPSNIQVMNADAIRLAIQNYSDATGFVQILEANDFEDWAIGAPIFGTTGANNLAGDTLLVLQPVMGIQVGSLVYCAGYDLYGLVLEVQNIYQVPAGIPFAKGYADLVSLFPPQTAVAEPRAPAPVPVRIMPPLGTLVSTNVTIAPALDNLMVQGSTVSFAIGAPTTVTIPTLPPGNRGTP